MSSSMDKQLEPKKMDYLIPDGNGQRASDVLVIIPAFNEALNIGNVVQTVNTLGLGDIVVIDDGSSDQTSQKAEEAGAHVIRLPFNLGIGGAVQTGFKYGYEMGYPYVLRLDGDGQHVATESFKLLEAVKSGQADVAIGSRFNPGQQTYTPPRSRAMGIRWFAKLISWITRKPAYDTTSGMQVANRRACKILAREYPQDYPEVEARILFHQANLQVLEIPAEMKPRAAGMSSITFFRAIYYVIKVTMSTFLSALRRVSQDGLEDI